MRTIVIGDIHGSALALQQVLDRSGFDPKVDRLIQLGDVADGWPETAQCVDILLDVQAQAGEANKPVFIRGNHDVWTYDWFDRGWTPMIWTEQGGKATMESYISTGKLADDNHKAFWKNQVDWFIDEGNNLFIHAGWDYLYGWPEGALIPVSAGSIAKECHWDRSLVMSAMSAFSPNFKGKGRFKALEGFKEVFVGHTALNGEAPEPKNWGNLWNIDTGCGWFGVLTGIDLDTKEFWQSDRSFLLYPDARGRR